VRKSLFLSYILLFLLSGCLKQPEILISGVENGKVYPDDRTITINAEKAEYTMMLNGEPIESGHIVKNNGEYRLLSTVKKLWMETEKEIVFTIDDQPPNAPTFKEEIQPGYFKEAKLELLEEDGVTYTITLNGEPYDLSKPIQAEGDYQLEILAKKENGMGTRRVDSFIVDNQTFTQETVDAFLAFHFGGVGVENPFIIKWMGERVRVFVHGTPTNQDLNQLNTSFHEFSQWLPVQFEIKQENDRNDTGYQLDLYFVPNEQFKDYGYTDDLFRSNGETIGFTLPTEGNSRDGLLKAVIAIDSTIPQALRNATILHELVHSLGMFNHFEDDKSSILYPQTNQNITKLNETDRVFLEMLYRADILPGMTEEEIRQLWATRIVE
jgi:hypothetical protein